MRERMLEQRIKAGAWDRVMLSARLLPGPVQVILTAEVHDAEQRINNVRIVLGFIGLLLILVNAQTNSLGAVVWSAATVGVYTLGSGFVRWMLHGREHRWWTQYLSISLDMFATTLFHVQSLASYSGAYEALLAPVLPMLFVMFNILTAAVFSVEASLYAALVSSLGRFVVVAYVVGAGLVEISETSVYGVQAVNVADQLTIVGIIGLSGVAVATFTRFSRRVLLKAAEETVRKEQAQAAREQLGKYLSPSVVDYLTSFQGSMPLGGQRRVATVMFVDIRNFTPLTERESPEEVLALLNGIFPAFVEIIFRHRGTLDKFLGDGLLAVFGVPFPHENGPKAALEVAIELKEAIRSYNRAGKPERIPDLRIGVGIAHGEVIAGNVGSQQRLEFTVIGDTVNFAARIQEKTKDFNTEILVSEPVARLLEGQFAFRAMPPVSIRGKKNETVLYGLEGSGVLPKMPIEFIRTDRKSIEQVSPIKSS